MKQKGRLESVPSKIAAKLNKLKKSTGWRMGEKIRARGAR